MYFKDVSRHLAVTCVLGGLMVGCSGTLELDPDCPGGTMRSGDQCIPASDQMRGCTNPAATNYDPNATTDDGSCIVAGLGCTDSNAANYDPNATTDDGSCSFLGCTHAGAVNFDPNATTDDNSCRFEATFAVDMSAVANLGNGVAVHGSFNDWCGNCAPLTDADNDGIYTGTIAVTAGEHIYRFVVLTGPPTEETVPDECNAAAAGETAARGFLMPASATSLAAIPFGACSTSSLPFTVDDVFAPSGFMGDGEIGGLVADLNCPMRAGMALGNCHKFTYTPMSRGFAGVFWQYPDGNWGPLPGFAVPQGATRINFWAWGESGGEVVKFLAGIMDADGFGLETAEIPLTNTPTEYQISLVGVSYTEIVGGFGWVAPAPAGGPITIHIDDIQYQNVPGDITNDIRGCTDLNAQNYNAAATVDDGSCEYNVSFEVDMSCAGPFSTVFVTGPFCSWCDRGFELLDDNSDDIYTGTFTLPGGPLEHKFMVDNFASQEDLLDDVMAAQGSCAPITDGATFANREITVDSSTTTTAVYGRCGTCN